MEGDAFTTVLRIIEKYEKLNIISNKKSYFTLKGYSIK